MSNSTKHEANHVLVVSSHKVYNEYILNTSSLRKCSQCNSDLTIASSVTERLEGSLFPQTTTVFKCTNSECQERMDKETEKRLKLKKEKETSDKRRMEVRAKRV